mgnify:CR=1 FL=1
MMEGRAVEGRAGPGGPSKDCASGRTHSLSAWGLCCTGRVASVRPIALAPPRDRWLARDKARHMVVSGLWTLSTQYVLVNNAGWTEADALPVSVASGATVGLAKELYDASRPTGRASAKDLVANAVGIALAVGVIAL